MHACQWQELTLLLFFPSKFTATTVVQTGMPMTALSVLGGQFRLKTQTRAQLYQEFLPWAVRAGFRSADLMCLYYEKHFEVRQGALLECSSL